MRSQNDSPDIPVRQGHRAKGAGLGKFVEGGMPEVLGKLGQSQRWPGINRHPFIGEIEAGCQGWQIETGDQNHRQPQPPGKGTGCRNRFQGRGHCGLSPDGKWRPGITKQRDKPRCGVHSIRGKEPLPGLEPGKRICNLGERLYRTTPPEKSPVFPSCRPLGLAHGCIYRTLFSDQLGRVRDPVAGGRLGQLARHNYQLNHQFRSPRVAAR